MSEQASESTRTRKSTSGSAKKAPAKKAPAKRSATKKAGPATATTSKTRARPASRPAHEAPGSQDGRQRRDGTGIAQVARDIVRDLTGATPEGVTSIQRSDDGWQIEVEVLELERIPSTTDVLATYAVDLDGDEEVQGYRRVRRYLRGTPGGEHS